MDIDYEGKSYPFDMDEVTVKQAIKIEKHMGCSFVEWGGLLEKGSSMQALQALGWLVLHGGRDVPIEDTDFKMVPLGEGLTKAMAAQAAADEAAAAAAAGPTGAPPANGHVPAPLVLSAPSSETASP